MQTWIILLLLVVGTILQSMFTTILVVTFRQKQADVATIFFFGTNTVFITFLLVYMTTQMAMLHESSDRAFVQLKPKLTVCSSRKELRLRKRFYRSCWTIKQQFGSHNFVDRLTPFNTINVANNLSVNLLLIK